MKSDGRCHCGEITFEAEVDPNAFHICHCTDCQTLSGSAFRANIPAPAEHFVLLIGTPETYVKTAEIRQRAALSPRRQICTASGGYAHPGAGRRKGLKG